MKEREGMISTALSSIAGSTNGDFLFPWLFQINQSREVIESNEIVPFLPSF